VYEQFFKEEFSFLTAVRIFYLNILKREGLMMACNKLNLDA